MPARIYPDSRQASSTIKSEESGNYEAFVVDHCCQLLIIQPQILGNQTNKPDRETVSTTFPGDYQLLLSALQKNTSGCFLALHCVSRKLILSNKVLL